MLKLWQLQGLERVAGPIICLFLEALRPLLPRPKNTDPRGIRKILLIKFWGIGSLTLATPFMARAREIFPNSQIHLLTLSGNEELVNMLPLDVKGHYVNLGDSLFSAVKAFVSSLLWMFGKKFEIVFDMEFYTRASAIVTFFTCAPVRVGYHCHRVWRGSVHNRRVPFNVYRHVSCNFLSLLEPFGYQPSNAVEMPELKVSHAGTMAADELLRELGLTGQPLVIFNPNASDLGLERRWPGERYAELASLLLKKYSIKALFIGSKKEFAYVETVVEQIRRSGCEAYNIAGKIPLAGLADIFRKSILTISNDSGPLHLAAVMGSRVVGFFGPETPVLYGPVGSDCLEIFANISCSPCVNIEGGKRMHCIHDTNRCMQVVDVPWVLERIESRFGRILKPLIRKKIE